MKNLTSLRSSKRFKNKIIGPEKLCEIIKPGSRVFISSGPATPMHAINYVSNTIHPNFEDIEVIQLTTPPDVVLFRGEKPERFRFKTFSIGQNISRAMQEGLLDVVPTTIAELPYLFLSGAVKIDVAVVQTSLPDNHGNLNLGTVNDINRIAIEKAGIAIAEVNPNVPFTYGETSIFLDEFDYVLESQEPLLEFATPPYDLTLDRIGEHVATLVDDGSMVSLSMGRMFDAIAYHLREKKDLKVWSHIISDWIIGLVESGAIHKPENIRRDSPVIATSCIGTKSLYSFIDGNPYISLLPLFYTTYQQAMAQSRRLVSVLNVNRIDITGESAIISSRDQQITGFDSKMYIAVAATHSPEGKVIVALRSTDREGNSNIVLSHDFCSNQMRNALGTARYVVTEYGIASIFGKSIRERVLALLEIAHPDHRQRLFDEAKRAGLVFADQIYTPEYAKNYPSELEKTVTFKGKLAVHFRPIKPTDEDGMRRLFYRFSDEAKYLRYFSAIRTMSHREMQRYVNVDHRENVSLVGIIQDEGVERIIAECRYSYYAEEDIYETAFIVDEEFQGRGIATFMLDYLIEVAGSRGLERLSAYVLAKNDKMISVFEKCRIAPRVLDEGDSYRYDFYL